MSVEWPWSELGLDGPADERGVKRAYAVRLKALDRSDVDAVQTLRQAFDAARQIAVSQMGVEPVRRPKMAEITEQTHPPEKPVDTARVEPPTAAFTPLNANLEMSRPFVSLQERAEVHDVALQRLMTALEAVLAQRKRLRPASYGKLQEIFDEAVRLDRPDQIDFERALLQGLVTHKTKVTEPLARLIDQSFYWLSDGTGATARLMPDPTGAALLAKLGRIIIPRDRFWAVPSRMWARHKLGRDLVPPASVEELAACCLGAVLVPYMFWKLWDMPYINALEPDALLILLIVIGLIFFALYVFAFLLEGLFKMLDRLRVLGNKRLLMRALPIGMRNWMSDRRPTHRGIALLTVLLIVVTLMAWDISWLNRQM